MSLTLDTVSSPVVDGRCAGCGRFISRYESHFHGPPRKFSGPPRAYLSLWHDSGFVVRCDDPEEAHQRMVGKYIRTVGDWVGDREHLFPASRGIVQRGRVIPEFYDVWRARWHQLPDDHAKGPGITTAVVWSP